VQFLHAELPVRSEYLPALQSVHPSCPVLPVYLPWLRTAAMSLVSPFAKFEWVHSRVCVFYSPRVPFTRRACRRGHEEQERARSGAGMSEHDRNHFTVDATSGGGFFASRTTLTPNAERPEVSETGPDEAARHNGGTLGVIAGQLCCSQLHSP
jgi:hypothetical protein